MTSATEFRRAADKGRAFLAGLFDPALDLLPEYRGSRVYWLFHDNYLAAKILQSSHPELATKITATMRGFDIERSGKIEIVFGEARDPLPFRHYELTEVRRVGDKIIRTEVVRDAVFVGWEEYADLLFLAAMAESDADRARSHCNAGLQLWDGVGLRDRVFAKTGKYAIYKLALALLACKHLKLVTDEVPAITARLLAQQGSDGGWITDYAPNGKPLGQANTETTSLAIVALDRLAQ